MDGGISSQRAAQNQSAYRSVNERIKDLNQTFEELGEFGSEWVCECADTLCTVRLAATTTEYEAVRANPRAFIVRPGHEIPDIERTIAGNARYLVVEKLDSAGETAEALDPRHGGDEPPVTA